MRFQGDTQWQADFGRLLRVSQEQAEHIAAGRQCLREGAVAAARDELECAGEDQEIIDCLEQALKDMTECPL
jgi:hypothetical protein